MTHEPLTETEIGLLEQIRYGHIPEERLIPLVERAAAEIRRLWSELDKIGATVGMPPFPR